jgi:hypothetical protein
MIRRYSTHGEGSGFVELEACHVLAETTREAARKYAESCAADRLGEGPLEVGVYNPETDDVDTYRFEVVGTLCAEAS